MNTPRAVAVAGRGRGTDVAGVVKRDDDPTRDGRRWKAARGAAGGRRRAARARNRGAGSRRG